ncbi:hypothetical protein O9G_002888 [Rozella allomycis CSF55]|uniref:Uncharacterized protein n=1 Tax=Rozella allomycis (strain CSF55) TaxID=988480 RepID=A0A075AWN6_ROZAC|nr:hypothetical protein O9G_002888 [Rozella allomycis CSF55]|eukprot:EPZ33087.1 hypothetical protein O9G_002888 [Rozella allomycis CSF55]
MYLNDTNNATTLQYYVPLTSNDQDVSIADFRLKISEIIDRINIINNTILSGIDVEVASVNSSFQTFASAATNLVNNTNTLLLKKRDMLNYANLYINETKNEIITRIIPNIVSDIRLFAGNASVAMDAVGECKSISTSLTAFENSICIILQ